MWPFTKSKDEAESPAEEEAKEEDKDGGNGKEEWRENSGVYHFNGQQIAKGDQARRLHRADTNTRRMLEDIDEKIAHLQKLKRLLESKNHKRDEEKERKDA